MQIKWIEFIPDKEYPSLKEHLYFCESEYLNYEITLDGIKDASRYDEIQLLSTMSGNFSICEIFLGSIEHMYEYLQEERQDELDGGQIAIQKENLLIVNCKWKIKNVKLVH